MHAEQDPADADQRDERDDHGDEGGPPAAAGRGQEDQQHRPVTDDRAEGVAAGEAVPAAVRDRVGHHRAQPADQVLQDRVQDQRAGAGDQQVASQPPAAPEGQEDRRHPDDRPQHPVTAQKGDRLDHRHQGGMPGDEGVDPGSGAVVGGLQRVPLQADQDEQDREDQRGAGHHEQRGEAAVSGLVPVGGPAAEGVSRHGRQVPAARAFTHRWRVRVPSAQADRQARPESQPRKNSRRRTTTATMASATSAL